MKQRELVVVGGGPAGMAAALAARAAGLVLAPAQLQLEGPRQLRLRANVPFDRWLEWVAALQRDARLRLVNCRVDAPDVAGGIFLGGAHVEDDRLAGVQ